MTEKDYAPKKSESKDMIVKAPKEKVESAPVKAPKGVPPEADEGGKKENAKETKEKKPSKAQPVPKKDNATVNAKSLHVSTKYAKALCKFIKFKTPEQAIADLEEVLKMKKAVPMTGEIPHKPGKGMMSGRYPIRAAEQFLTLVKSLQSNANANSMDEPIIIEAVPNMAARPYGRFGRHKKKRTHVNLKVVEKKSLDKKKKAKKKVGGKR